MAQLVEREYFGKELQEMGKRTGPPLGLPSSISFSSGSDHSMRDCDDDDEYELKWAGIKRLSTIRCMRTSVLGQPQIDGGGDAQKEKRVVDVSKLGALERKLLIEKLIKHIADDNLQLLQKQRERIERVNVKVPTIEVRYKNLNVDAKCEVVQGRPLPTVWNTLKSTFLGLARLPGLKSEEAKIHILKSVSGIIRPSRMTLLLGPPGCGKTTLLLALAGKLDKSLEVKGDISYNGFRLEEFVPEKTSAYISQYDVHNPDMTVRETLDFSARFQGVGSRAEIMEEVCSREKEAGIVPEADVDAYMKAISVEGLESSVQTDYILKIMGLDICADTMIGDAMRKGISGGQKRRLTTGEMIVGPTKALFMDEISNGLDSATTFQIVTCLQQFAHITEATLVVSLLQPSPDAYDLFDDVILMAEGKIVYHGPRVDILKFFEECGFKCPETKGAADFLQEVLSRKDQEQYWSNVDEPYSYVCADQFSKKFATYHVGQRLEEELLKPYIKSNCHPNALSFAIYSLPKWELFKACMARELLLMKRHSTVYIFKTAQILTIAIIMKTVFIHTRMRVDIRNANYYLGSLFYALITFMVNGMPELAMTVTRLPVFYKQRDFYFFPAWAYTIPASIIKIPISLVESFLWTCLTYYIIGYSPEAVRFFRHFFLLFLIQQVSLSLFRFLASYFQTMVASTVSSTSTLLVIMLFGGFILPRHSMPVWLRWGFWISPLTYSEIGLTVNEFLAPRWQKISSANDTLGLQVMESRGLNFSSYYYWISAGVLFGYILLFNVAFTLALTFKKTPGGSRAIISRKKLCEIQKVANSNSITDLRNISANESSRERSRTGKNLCPVLNRGKKNVLHKKDKVTCEYGATGRMILPFVPFTVAFHEVNYYVDTPPEMREQGYTEKKLQLLHNITGTFQPGILSALMGVSGAGKTTLLDVLSGRKSKGIIEGDIKIGGYPKVQKTFARISAYCEQNDIHSPHITVEESLVYSAWLRLPSTIDSNTRSEFVNEVLETTELDGIKDSLVGIPGVYGLSTEQRKRLTIGVELVSNPSIIFMDEPTSGLDARAAAIVMRAVKKVVETGRTVVCTIHQPSIDIFEVFDQLILMKRGGELVYSGPLGQHSSKVIEYFEGIPGVPRIKDNYNPATWMLEIISASHEQQINIDFAQIYRASSLYRDNELLVKQLSTPPPDSLNLDFPSRFPQNGWVQFKACLWKQYLSYWRSPSYILVRIIFIILTATIFGVLFWKHGKIINNNQDLFNILGSMFMAMNFLGINNCSSVVPFVATERSVLYREKFAGMYSPWAYSFAQMVIEVPYVFFQAVLFAVITYPAIGYYWSAYKFLWYFYTMFCTLLYYVYLGMLLVSLTPNVQLASILTSPWYSMQNLFSGYIIPRPHISKWWIWFYYVCPMSWSLNGIFTSQYGDLKNKIVVFGVEKPISSFLRDYFGFHHEELGFVAIILIGYPLLFGFLFAFCIGKLNFQKR